MSTPKSIASLEEFLAHAYALEHESVDRYEELADAMETHHNEEVAALFRKFAEFGRLHAKEVEDHADGMTLLKLSPSEFKWSSPEGPETGNHADIDYLMTPAQAMKFALRNEIRGRDFYAAVAEGSPSEQVRKLAAEFTEEEDEHVDILEQWIEKTPEPEERPIDLDEPHSPD